MIKTWTNGLSPLSHSGMRKNWNVSKSSRGPAESSQLIQDHPSFEPFCDPLCEEHWGSFSHQSLLLLLPKRDEEVDEAHLHRQNHLSHENPFDNGQKIWANLKLLKKHLYGFSSCTNSCTSCIIIQTTWKIQGMPQKHSKSKLGHIKDSSEGLFNWNLSLTLTDFRNLTTQTNIISSRIT